MTKLEKILYIEECRRRSVEILQDINNITFWGGLSCILLLVGLVIFLIISYYWKNIKNITINVLNRLNKNKLLEEKKELQKKYKEAQTYVMELENSLDRYRRILKTTESKVYMKEQDILYKNAYIKELETKISKLEQGKIIKDEKNKINKLNKNRFELIELSK